MALNGLAEVLGNGDKFIPWVEEAALDYIRRNYVMLPRVTVFDDMKGFNTRKVSEYILPGRAVDLSEDTAIPDSELVRARRAEIAPYEVGNRQRVSDRRVDTDLEDIIADISAALGKSIGDRIEVDLLREASSSLIGGSFGSSSTDYSIDLPLNAQYEMKKRNGGTTYGKLYHIIHPFQAREIMKDLIEFNGSAAGQVALDFRNSAISAWRVPGFDNAEIVVSDWLPRHIEWRVRIDGTGGTFRLSVAGLTTGAITVSATPATTATNIKTALDALAIGTWTVADGGGGNLDIDVTSPAALFVFPDEELSVAIDPANATLPGQKSAYDLVTTPDGTPLGVDLAGVNYGVDVQERSAYVKSLFFFRRALVFDNRETVKTYFELVNQGRTAEYSIYTKFGVGYWQPNLGMYLLTKAESAFAVA